MHGDPTTPDTPVATWRAASRWLVPVALGLVLATNVVRAWTATARGLDFSDEGFYLASARWFRHPELASTGAPALLGPLFHLVGLSVPWFRRLRIVLFVVTGAALGHATGRLIDDGSRPRRVDLALFGAIGSFTIYASLPQSSGYNDASVLCATVVATCTLRAWRAGDRSRLGWTAGAGAAAVFALLTKWPAGFVEVAVVAAVTVYVLGARRCVRLVPAAAAGAAVALVLVEATSGDLMGLLRELRSTSSTITTQLPPWDAYFVPYRKNLLGTLGELLRGSGLVPFVFTGLMVLHQRATSSRARMVTIVAAGAASAWVCWFAVRDGLLRGGSTEVARQLRFVPLLVLAALALWFARAVTAPVGRELGATVERSVRGPVVLVMVGLAGAQAVGTLNPPLYVIGFAGALVFVATAAICAVAEQRLRPVARAAGAVLLSGAALAPSVLFQTGAWRHPYRNAVDLGAQRTVVHAEPFDGVAVDAPTATLLEQLRALADERGLVGRPGLSLFATPGLAYALGLTPPLVSLFVRTSDIAAATTYPLFEQRVQAACERSFISGAEPPVLLTVATTPDAAVQQMLRGCGVDFPAGFTMVSFANPGLVDVPAGDIRVWIPT